MIVNIGKHTLSENNPAFVMAEMSGNHGGSIDRALKIIHSAKKAGADAVKLQTFTADTITLKSTNNDFSLPKDSPWSEHKTLWDLYNEAHTPWEWHEEIFKEARSIGLEIFSSPFDESAVDFLEDLGVSAYKIASPEITHIPLIEKVAITKKPVVISTGVANIEDLDLAVNTLKKSGCKEIIILKCTSAYPTPANELNLITLSDMKSRYKTLVGLSDHTTGNVAATTSIALGAKFIEKHFKIEDGHETVDSFFSCNEQDFKALVEQIRYVEDSLGTVNYEISKSSKSSINGRRSIYVSSNIKKGEKISKSNIKVVRPSHGLHPRFYNEIIGKKVNTDLELGDRITLDMID